MGSVCCRRKSGLVTACEDCPASWRIILLWGYSWEWRSLSRRTPFTVLWAGHSGCVHRLRVAQHWEGEQRLVQPSQRGCVCPDVCVPPQPHWSLCQGALHAGPCPALQACLLPLLELWVWAHEIVCPCLACASYLGTARVSCTMVPARDVWRRTCVQCLLLQLPVLATQAQFPSPPP